MCPEDVAKAELESAGIDIKRINTGIDLEVVELHNRRRIGINTVELFRTPIRQHLTKISSKKLKSNLDEFGAASGTASESAAIKQRGFFKS